MNIILPRPAGVRLRGRLSSNVRPQTEASRSRPGAETPRPQGTRYDHRLKNIQVIDGADNCVYDIFQATEEEFSAIFPVGQDVAFIDEVYARGDRAMLDRAFNAIWTRRIPKVEVQGIHGLLFYELIGRKRYYPTRKDEEAINPDGTRLR